VRRRAALCALLLALAEPARAQLGDLYGHAWLRVADPAAPEARSELPLVEVSGQAGARGLRTQDVILAIDISDSTIEPCGIDLDGDGEAGRTSDGMRSWLARQPEVRETLRDRVERHDFDDSVLMAELAAAWAIVSQADPRAFRVGIVAFSGHAWVAAPLGSTREQLIDALDHLRWNFFYDLGGTDFADAVRASGVALGDLAPGDDRQRSVIFLSDGATSGGRPIWDVEAAVLAAAREVAERGIRVYSYALGPEAEQELDVYRGMAELAGGRFEKLDRPSDAVSRLRAIDFAEAAELEVVNLSTGGAARALRRFPDGSFDALVELATGPNRLRFVARASNGTSEAAERVVRYEPPAELGAAEQEAQRQRLEELAQRVRERTAETRFIAEMGRREPLQRREIELRAEASRRRTAPAPGVGSGPKRGAAPSR
jgi:hypothetical protein